MMKNPKNILIVALLIIIALLTFNFLILDKENKNKEKKIVENQNFMRVMNDSLHHYKTENGELGVYKSAFQNDMKTLKENYKSLTENQKALYQEIKENKNIITAMRSEISIKIENLINHNPAQIINDTTIVFTDSTTNLNYKITVTGVKPSNNNPQLTINELELPDSMTVKHEWDKDGKVIVKVENSNPYVKVEDVDGYIIPEATKKNLKPSLKDKFKKAIKSSSKVGAGLLIGAGIVTLIILL